MATRVSPNARCSEILDFYFGPAARTDCDLETFRTRTKFWFFRSEQTDSEIRTRFAADVEKAADGELDEWRETALGRLALIVLLDQFPRNLNRESPRAFAHDTKALAIALEGLERGHAEELTAGERLVFYLPLMHAEDRAIQARSMELYTHLPSCSEALRQELEMALKFADRHRYIVERFGRFPHRNKALGRESTPEEIAFLQEPSSSF